MSYEKQTWVTGETITASKLNHMEDGIASDEVGSFLISFTPTSQITGTIDKTYSEIIAAIQNGQIPIINAFIANEYGGSLAFDGVRGDTIEFRTTGYEQEGDDITVTVTYVYVNEDNTINYGEFGYTVSSVSPTPQ